MSVFGPSAFGVPGPPVGGGATVADRRGDARLALFVLAAALAAIYGISAVTLAGRAPATAGVLIGVAAVEVGWLVLVRTLRRATLQAGVVINLLLVAVWVLSRMRGQSVGVLDTLCALDAATLACVSWMLAGRRLESFGAPLSHLAILLAAVSLTALAGGHTHTARAAGPPSLRLEQHTFYCRLL